MILELMNWFAGSNNSLAHFRFIFQLIIYFFLNLAPWLATLIRKGFLDPPFIKKIHGRGLLKAAVLGRAIVVT